jgi:uncharacterized membrane protein
MMNPQQIRRREHTGLTALAVGLLAGLTGVGCLLLSWVVGLTFVSIGAAGLTTGLVVLHKIPDVIGQSEELW